MVPSSTCQFVTVGTSQPNNDWPSNRLIQPARISSAVSDGATNSTAASHYLVFSDSATGNEDMRTDTSLFYNPSTNVLTCGSLDATVDGGSY